LTNKGAEGKSSDYHAKTFLKDGSVPSEYQESKQTEELEKVKKILSEGKTPDGTPIDKKNDLTTNKNTSTLSSTSQTEAGTGESEMNAETNKKADFNKKAESKGFHPMINHREDGSFGVKIPFDMKDAFKKQFSSAKWDGTTKEWTVGKLSGQKLNTWLQDKIPHIEEKAASKADFEAKKSEMHPLSGQTFDIKDDLKNKFGAIYDVDYKTWRVPAEHKEAAQKFVNEHNENKKGERKSSREARQKELSRAPTSEEQKSINAWMEQNPAEEENLRDDEYRYAVQTGGWHIKEQKKEINRTDDWSKYSRGDD
jgi:hypothetical protein